MACARGFHSFTRVRVEPCVGRGETPERESERQREPERTVRRERGKHGRDEPRAITNPARRGVCAQLTAHSDYLLASVSFGSMCSSGLSEWPTTLTNRERDVADGASNHSHVVGSDPATVFLVWCWAGMGKAERLQACLSGAGIRPPPLQSERRGSPAPSQRQTDQDAARRVDSS